MENETNNTTVAQEQLEATQPEENSTQAEKTFTQEEVNKIVSERLAREKSKTEAIYTQAMNDIEARENAIAEKEKDFADREKMWLDRENRLTAIKAIKEAGLDDGSGLSLELVDFVMSDDVENTKNKVKIFGELVARFVTAEVNRRFKENGYAPKKSGVEEDKSNLKRAFGL